MRTLWQYPPKTPEIDWDCESGEDNYYSYRVVVKWSWANSPEKLMESRFAQVIWGRDNKPNWVIEGVVGNTIIHSWIDLRLIP